MSEKKVHLFTVIDRPDEAGVIGRRGSVCGRFTAHRWFNGVAFGGYLPDTRDRMATIDVFRWLPPEAQCAHCARIVDSVVQSRHILSVSLFCGALAGCLDSTLAALVTGDDASRAVALDLAEERGLDRPGMWSVVEREWLRVERHEHRWFNVANTTAYWHEYDGRRAHPRSAPARRCTCGMYEAESYGLPIVYADDHPLHPANAIPHDDQP